jgi:hypothetical protein
VLTARNGFRATKSVDQSIPGGSGYIKITFDTASINNNSLYSTTNSRWTPVAGKVYVHAEVTIGYFDVNTPQYVFIYKNGLRAASKHEMRTTGGGDTLALQVSMIDQASGSDYYEVYMLITNTTGTSTSFAYDTYGTFFEGFEIGNGGPTGSTGAPGPAGVTGPMLSKDAFNATKNATQTLTSGALTKVTFGSTTVNTNSYFSTANSRWTPPAGNVVLSANVVVDNINKSIVQIGYIYKNGAKIYQGSAFGVAQLTSATLQLTAIDNANGTDYYEVWVNATGTPSISNDGTANWFMGHAL